MKRKMTYEENYNIGFLEGYRIGRVTATRETLIRVLREKGKEHGATPSRQLIQKINREIDIGILDKVIFTILPDNMALEELETYFDMFFLTPDEIRDNIYCQ